MKHIKFDRAENFYFHHGMDKKVAETGAYHSLYEIFFLMRVTV